MGKAEKGSAKYIANRIKAKGLQKLRWYCQMCQKQCRDENGFKCHTTSESHQRQLLLFADNASHYIDGFSREFRDGYLELLRRQFGTRRVSANKVYQDYIGNREHVHMNATQWETLTEFVKWLGREGKCVVDETEKGWFVTYIDREPAALAAASARAKRDKADRDDQERMLRFVERQVERGRAAGDGAGGEGGAGPSELRRAEGEERLTLSLSLKRPALDRRAEPLSSSALAALAARREPATKRRRRRSEETARPSALQDIIAAEEAARDRNNRKENWVCEGIVVKIVGEGGEGGAVRGRKAAVEGVRDLFTAHLRLLDSDTTLALHQRELETVIPCEGRRVRCVNGAYRGHLATLTAIHPRRYCCDLELSSGALRGRRVTGVQYEDVCKLAE